MRIKIEEIYSRLTFPGLIMGKPKPGMFEIENAKIRVGITESHIIDVSSEQWTVLKESEPGKMGYGTWGHISRANITISEGDANYSFCLIFNYVPENEHIEDKISSILKEVDWKKNSQYWDIGDL
jgi:hypothetical protein